MVRRDMPGSLPLPAGFAAPRAARENPRPKRRRKPTLSQVILRAAAVPAAGRGASLAAIKKGLEGEGYDVRKNKGRIKALLRSLLSQGALRRVSGSGASGSFRLRRGGGAAKAEKRGTAAVKGRQRGAKTGTAAPEPRDPSGDIKAAAARPKRLSRSPGKSRGTVATRRKQILDDIIRGAFLLE